MAEERIPGWEKRFFKNDSNPLKVFKSTWTTVESWEEGSLELGPTIFSIEPYAKYPTTKAADRATEVEYRYVRRKSGNVTKHGKFTVDPNDSSFEDSVTTGQEWIQESDLPLDLQFRQNSPSALPMTFHGLGTVMHNPSAFSAHRQLVKP